MFMLKLILRFIGLCIIALITNTILRYLKIKGEYIFYLFIIVSLILVGFRKKELLGLFFIFSGCCYSLNQKNTRI